jgi:hypothetical protein
MIRRTCRGRMASGLATLSVAALLFGIAVTLGGVFGLFTSTSANPSNNFTVAPDLAAPSASASVIGKTAGSSTGYIKQGATYYVYANVTDTGNPASGTSTVSSNNSSITTGATSTSLASGSFPAGGATYDHRTGSVTANGTLAEGTYNYSLSVGDVAGNSRTQTGFTVVVDNTSPTASDIQSANASGGTAGRAEAGDTITDTFSEPPDQDSILPGWDGTSTTVTIRIFNGLIVLGNDFLRVYDSSNSAQLPLGTVDLGRSDYVGGLLGLGEATTFSSSSMALSGNSLTVTLGTPDGNVLTAAGNGTMQWTPSTSATDRAGNAMSSSSANEQGGGDKEF